MKQPIAPHWIDFSQLGSDYVGYISVAESYRLPFSVRRVFWTYHTPDFITRGRHAHYQTEQILLALSGRIVVVTEDFKGCIQTFVLDRPNKGLYIGTHTWHTMQYSNHALQLVLASTDYLEADYIRDYEMFRKTIKKMDL